MTRRGSRECGAKRQTCADSPLGASAAEAPAGARGRKRPPDGGAGRARGRRNGPSPSPSSPSAGPRSSDTTGAVSSAPATDALHRGHAASAGACTSASCGRRPLPGQTQVPRQDGHSDPGLRCRSTIAHARAPDPALAEPHRTPCVVGGLPHLPDTDRARTLPFRADPGHLQAALSDRCAAVPVLLAAHRASSVPGRRTRPIRIPDPETAP